jgi:hypothetical protein
MVAHHAAEVCELIPLEALPEGADLLNQRVSPDAFLGRRDQLAMHCPTEIEQCPPT